MKIALVDLETSALHPRNHGEIIEIGMVVFDSETLEILDEMDMKVAPVYDWLGDPKAYALNGYTKEGWANAIPLERAILVLSQKAKGAVFMAYNATFDWIFLDDAFAKLKAESPFHYRKICVLSMAYGAIPHDKIKGWKLSTVCDFLGVPPEPAVHRAINGARSAYEVYKKLVGLNSI